MQNLFQQIDTNPYIRLNDKAICKFLTNINNYNYSLNINIVSYFIAPAQEA